MSKVAEALAPQDYMPALRAIAEGYKVRGQDDRYIVVENPEFREDDGSNPNLVIDVEAFR